MAAFEFLERSVIGLEDESKADAHIDHYMAVFQNMMAAPNSYNQSVVELLPRLITCILRDLSSQQSELSVNCFKCAGYILHMDCLCETVAQDVFRSFFDALANIIAQSSSKSIVVLAFWCHGMQNIPSIAREFSAQFLEIGCASLAKARFESSGSVEFSVLQSLRRIQQQSPHFFLQESAKWAPKVFPLLLHPSAKIQNLSDELLSSASKAVGVEVRVCAITLNVLENGAFDRLDQMFDAPGSVSEVLQRVSHATEVIGHAFRLLGVLLSNIKSPSLCRLLELFKRSVNHKEVGVRVLAQKCWRNMIDSVALPSPVALRERIDLLMMPLKFCAEADDSALVRKACVDTWTHLVAAAVPTFGYQNQPGAETQLSQTDEDAVFEVLVTDIVHIFARDFDPVIRRAVVNCMIGLVSTEGSLSHAEIEGKPDGSGDSDTEILEGFVPSFEFVSRHLSTFTQCLSLLYILHNAETDTSVLWERLMCATIPRIYVPGEGSPPIQQIAINLEELLDFFNMIADPEHPLPIQESTGSSLSLLTNFLSMLPPYALSLKTVNLPNNRSVLGYVAYYWDRINSGQCAAQFVMDGFEAIGQSAIRAKNPVLAMTGLVAELRSMVVRAETMNVDRFWMFWNVLAKEFIDFNDDSEAWIAPLLDHLPLIFTAGKILPRVPVDNAGPWPRWKGLLQRFLGNVEIADSQPPDLYLLWDLLGRINQIVGDTFSTEFDGKCSEFDGKCSESFALLMYRVCSWVLQTVRLRYKKRDLNWDVLIRLCCPLLSHLATEWPVNGPKMVEGASMLTAQQEFVGQLNEMLHFINGDSAVSAVKLLSVDLSKCLPRIRTAARPSSSPSPTADLEEKLVVFYDRALRSLSENYLDSYEGAQGRGLLLVVDPLLRMGLEHALPEIRIPAARFWGRTFSCVRDQSALCLSPGLKRLLERRRKSGDLVVPINVSRSDSSRSDSSRDSLSTTPHKKSSGTGVGLFSPASPQKLSSTPPTPKQRSCSASPVSSQKKKKSSSAFVRITTPPGKKHQPLTEHQKEARHIYTGTKFYSSLDPDSQMPDYSDEDGGGADDEASPTDGDQHSPPTDDGQHSPPTEGGQRTSTEGGQHSGTEGGQHSATTGGQRSVTTRGQHTVAACGQASPCRGEAGSPGIGDESNRRTGETREIGETGPMEGKEEGRDSTNSGERPTDGPSPTMKSGKVGERRSPSGKRKQVHFDPELGECTQESSVEGQSPPKRPRKTGRAKQMIFSELKDISRPVRSVIEHLPLGLRNMIGSKCSTVGDLASMTVEEASRIPGQNVALSIREALNKYKSSKQQRKSVRATVPLPSAANPRAALPPHAKRTNPFSESSGNCNGIISKLNQIKKQYDHVLNQTNKMEKCSAEDFSKLFAKSQEIGALNNKVLARALELSRKRA
eukprot:862208_1